MATTLDVQRELLSTVAMDAQRYDASKRRANATRLMIQTGIDESCVDPDPETPPSQRVDAFLEVLVGRSTITPLRTVTDSESSSVSTDWRSGTCTTVRESVSSVPTSVATTDDEAELEEDTAQEFSRNLKSQNKKQQPLAAHVHVTAEPEVTIASVRFERPRTRSLFSRSSPAPQAPTRPLSPFQTVLHALSLNCLTTATGTTQKKQFEREVDYLQTKRAREDRGSGAFEVAVRDVTADRFSRMLSREREDERNGPMLEMARRVVLEGDASVGRA
ncbi:Sacchrp-dh-NADP domain-containing protein [Mycena chlorophos]|uniref:Sacchrp-dh-NADP domain-containing protein n=1 Tax=Mycena chlorophos TaxID=658473 RepID=A0A8H6VQL7_MYCCL|nr:Sacchrp-dh-NADP domain-containing protein [Mycena chlorophos]